MAYDAATSAALYRNRRRSLAGRTADNLVPWSSGLSTNTGSYIRTTVTNPNGDVVTLAVFKVVTGGVTTVEPTITSLAIQSGGGGSQFQLVDGGARPPLLLTLPSPVPSP